MSSDVARVGPWTIRAKLGAGASAVVYAAVDGDGRTCALKVLHEQSDPESALRMEREARALEAIDHRAIVRVIEHGRLSDGRPWIAMEHIEGDSLRQRIERGEVARDPAAVWALVRPLCEGLAVAHDAGVLHRDVKPENVIVARRDGAARLVDFGLARIADPARSTLTGPGVALGTPPYMAPELWWNHAITSAVDQYAIACVLYELLAGRAPFRADSIGQWMEAHLHEAVAPLSLPGLDPTRSAAIDAVIRRALSKDAADRYPSMRAMILAADDAMGAVAPSLAPRWFVGGALPMLSIGAFALAGHGGSRSLPELVRLAGSAVFALVALALVASVQLVRRRASVGIAALIALAAITGTSTGWRVVLAAVARSEPEGRFAILHQGLYEAEVNRGIGAWVLWATLLATMLLAPSRASSVRALLAPSLVAVAAAVMALIDARSAALSVGCAAIALAVLATRRAEDRESLLRSSLLALGALVASWVLGAVHHGASVATVWNSALDRAQRVDLLTRLAREDSSLLLGAALSLGAWALATLGRWRALRWQRDARRALRVAAAPVGVALGLLALDAMQQRAVQRATAAARSAIAPQFALFSQLDLVVQPSLAPPHVAASVQLARDVVAIDGVAVARVAALDHERGRAALAQDLSHRFARERTSGAEGPRWTLAVDRRARWAQVRTVLAVARSVGAGPCELLFGRSANPRWTVWAPPESALALPSDYTALAVELGQGAGARFDDDVPFERVATALIARRADGVARVDVR